MSAACNCSRTTNFRPRCREDDFKIIQTQLAASVAGELQSPDHIAGHALTTALFPKGDPATRETTPASVKSLTIDDVKNYYAGAFRPDLTTIVVIGKISPENAVAVIEKYFGDWKASGEKPNTLFPPAPTNSVSVTHVPDASRVQDKITLAETLQLTRTNADYYALQLGNHVLGGGFYATRLYRDLREKSGLVYFVDSSFNIGLTRGVYQVAYACDPPNVSKARAVILSDLQGHADEKSVGAGIASGQADAAARHSAGRIERGLHRARLARHIRRSDCRSTNRFAPEKFTRKLDAGDVKNAFAKWLRPTASCK